MEIVHEINQLDFGGAERIIRNIVKFDSKNKHTVVAYKDGPFRKSLEDAGARVIVATVEEPEIDADIIHVHSGGAVSVMATQLGKAFPVVETIHSPIRSPMGQDIIRRRVGVCNAVTEMNDNCETILNGIDCESNVTRDRDDVRSSLGINPDALVVGRLGRIGQDKGLEDWLLTCYRLQKLGYDFIPVIVGGEASGLNGAYIGRLKLMAASLPVKNIVWVGHKEDVHNYLQIMDIFLYPSPTEGFGLVFAEAMLNNCTVVTYKTPVTEELLSGYAILTEKSIDGLVAGMKKALNPDMRDAYAGIVSNFVQSEYSAERMSLDYQELYERCNGHINGKS